MNTDNWREEMDKAATDHFKSEDRFDAQKIDRYHSFRNGALWMNIQLTATLKEKDKEIASLRAELEGLKEQIPGLLKEQREMCGHQRWKEGNLYLEFDLRQKQAILSAPSPQIKQP